MRDSNVVSIDDARARLREQLKGAASPVPSESQLGPLPKELRSFRLILKRQAVLPAALDSRYKVECEAVATDGTWRKYEYECCFTTDVSFLLWALKGRLMNRGSFTIDNQTHLPNQCFGEEI